MNDSNQNNKFEWIEFIRGAFAFISCLMIYYGWSSEKSNSILGFSNLSTDSLFLIGIFFSILFIVSSLEKIFTPVLELFLTKIVLTLSATGLIIICTAQASEILNRVFYIDASLLPFSRSFLAGILLFKKIYPFIMLLMVLMILYFFIQFYYWIKKTGKYGLAIHIKHISFIISTIICMCFSYKFNNVYFPESILSQKAYFLAKELDFYTNKVCKLSDEFKGKKIIYIDTQYKYVLVDKTSIEGQDLWKFIKYASEEIDTNNYWTNHPEKPKLSIQKCLPDL